MNSISNMEQYRDQIEELSTSFSEKDGFPPVCARIINYLLVKPEAEATFDELIQYFQVSKSAVSNGLKLLEQKNIIVSKTKHGQRKRYFILKMSVDDILDSLTKKHTQMVNYIADILKVRNSNLQTDIELQKILKLLQLIQTKHPILVEEFKKLI